jgi:hypothetical protein
MSHATIFIHVKEITQLLTPIAAVGVAAWLGVKSFAKQQRIGRIQKIYFEESLLEQINHIDNAINITSNNYTQLVTAINILFKHQTLMPEPVNIDAVKSILKNIQTPSRWPSSKKEISIILFRDYGYKIYQWQTKFDYDATRLSERISETLHSFSKCVGIVNQANLRDQFNDIKRHFELFRRHQTLAYLMQKIIALIAVLEFKSQKKLIKDIQKNNHVTDLLKKFDETFKILFGWYRIGNDLFLSYLKDEQGGRYQLSVQNQKITRIIDNFTPSDYKLTIVSNDSELAEIEFKINDEVHNYITEIQVGIANLEAFDEKPKSYPEVPSFSNS